MLINRNCSLSHDDIKYQQLLQEENPWSACQKQQGLSVLRCYSLVNSERLQEIKNKYGILLKNHLSKGGI